MPAPCCRERESLEDGELFSATCLIIEINKFLMSRPIRINSSIKRSDF